MEPNDDNIPPSLADLFPKFLDNPKVLVSPSDNEPMKIKNGMLCSYRYIGAVPLRDMGPGRMILYDHEPRAGVRIVGFYDGHVRRMPEAEFRRQLAEQYEQFKPIMEKPDFPATAPASRRSSRTKTSRRSSDLSLERNLQTR